MKRSEINKVFTDVVAKYIADGYVIHTNDMGGSQGQDAAIHMIKGNEFIAVIFSRMYEFTDRASNDFEAMFDRGLEIVVKRLPKPEYSGSTVWLNKGEVISVVRFYEIQQEYRYKRNGVVVTQEAWYTTDYEAFKACKKVQHKRYRGQHETKTVDLAVDGKVMAKVRATYGCKRAKLADVKVTIRVNEMVKGDSKHRYDHRYSVSCFGKSISL